MALIAQAGERLHGQPTSKYSQYVGVFVAMLTAFSIGTYLSWTSSALPLYNKNGALSLNDQEKSWISSALPLGAIPTVIPSAILTDKFGRKKMIWATSVLLFLCWYIGFTDSKICVFLARFVAGMACGAASVIVPMFISEIEHNTGGLFVIIFHLLVAGGIFFAYATAFSESLRLIAILCSVAPVLLLIFFRCIPESPTWLVMQDRKSEANIVLKRFRGSDYCIENELTTLELDTSEIRGTWANFLDLKNYQKTMCIILGLMIFQQFSGINALIFYASKIFDDTGSFLSSTTSSAIVGAAHVIATLLSIIIIERVGKKILLFISASVMSACMFTMSGYFHFQKSHDLSSVSWIPLLSFTVFIAIFSIGFGPIPLMMIQQLFTNHRMKSVVSSVNAVCNWTLAFLVTKCYQDAANVMGLSSLFASFGAMSLIGTVFVSAMVPETRGKSIEEIQVKFGIQSNVPREALTVPPSIET